jgi:DMSO/TMAO reductase YedYZ molybdopterin-dependent catalytic subunit
VTTPPRPPRRKLPTPPKLPSLPSVRKPHWPPPPPGPARPAFWRSPLRSTWLTAFIGSILLVLVLLVALTGFISHGAYRPGTGHNALVPPGDDIGPLITLPAGGPAWLYAFTQGAHITIGLIAIPLLLAKLWSVIPKLFSWPPVISAAQVLERVSILLLVGGALFEFATGVVNIQVYYPFHFNFVLAHYYGAWVFISALVLHVAVKLPTIRHAYRVHGAVKPLKDDLAHTQAHPYEPGGLAPLEPAAPTLSRRGLLALVGGASLTLLIVNLGESAGGPLRRLALLAPRGRVFGTGPNDFQVNKTADFVKVTKAASDPAWALEIKGRRTRKLSRRQLMAMPQYTYDMPIACVEGWSTTQRWTGVRLADLARLAGAAPGDFLEVHSMQTAGPFRVASFAADQVANDRALLALRVNGVDLSLDHGYPARIIIPALPGVHCTKWVGSMMFMSA